MKITGHTRLYGFFADPADHSKSPAMYNACFDSLGIDAVYLAFRCGREGIEGAMDAMRRFDMGGANISMPNKQAVIGHLDEISGDAALAEAVNTVVNREGRLIGHNTDIAGARRALEELHPIRGSRSVLFGLGGAGKAVLIALAQAGASHVSVFIRGSHAKEHVVFADRIASSLGLSIKMCEFGNDGLLREELAAADLLVNATNVGMGKLEGESLVPDPSFLHRDLAVMDAIYSPAETALLRQAKEAGCRAKNGLDMLLYQGAEAFSLFTGEEMPLELVREVLNRG